MIARRVWHMIIKEFLQSLRDKRMRMIIFGVPVIQLLMFGYAVNTDVRNIGLAVVDLDQSAESREFVSRFVCSGHFQVRGYLEHENRIGEILDTAGAQAVLRINAGFGRAVNSGQTATAQLLVDGADSNTAGIILGYASKIVRRYSQVLMESRLARTQGVVTPLLKVELQSRAWHNENLESRHYYVPGVMATIVTLISLLLTAMAIVREKELGTIEQILVTPIRPGEFVLGKTIPFALISFVDVIVVSVVGTLWFGIPIRGNPLCLLLGASMFLLSTLGVGLLISTVSRTQQQALMTGFFFFMPAMMLSGFMFPIANMPEPIQWLTLLNPLRHFLVVIRGVFLKGVGLDVLWPQVLALALLGVFTLSVTVKRFHKTLS